MDTSWIWDTECKTDVASDFLLFLEVSGLKKHTNSQMPINFFQLYLIDELFQLLVTETNWYTSQFITECEGNNGSDDSYVDTSEDTTIAEMKRFTGLLILIGIVYKPTIPMYWPTSELHNRPIFSKVMPCKCFQLPLKFLHFNNNDLHDLKYENWDRLHKLQLLIDILRKQCKEVYEPGQNLSIYEFLVLFKGQVTFHQYIKPKHAQFGIKLYELTTSNGITLDFLVYCGKGMFYNDNFEELPQSERIPVSLMESLCHWIEIIYFSQMIIIRILLWHNFFYSVILTLLVQFKSTENIFWKSSLILTLKKELQL